MTYSTDDIRDAEWDYEFEPPYMDEDDAEEIRQWRAALERARDERQTRKEAR